MNNWRCSGRRAAMRRRWRTVACSGKRRVLALVEPVDRVPDLGRAKTQPMHHGTRRTNLVFGYAAVSLGEVADRLKQRTDILLGQSAN